MRQHRIGSDARGGFGCQQRRALRFEARRGRVGRMQQLVANPRPQAVMERRQARLFERSNGFAIVGAQVADAVVQGVRDRAWTGPWPFFFFFACDTWFASLKETVTVARSGLPVLLNIVSMAMNGRCDFESRALARSDALRDWSRSMI